MYRHERRPRRQLVRKASAYATIVGRLPPVGPHLLPAGVRCGKQVAEELIVPMAFVA